MTPEEKSALNRRVALALGAKAYSSPCAQGHELYGRYYVAFKIQNFIDRDVTDTIERYQPYTEEMERVRSMPKIPDYCTDPAAAELVEGWFESGEWRLIQDFVPVCGGGKHWLVKAFKQDSIGKIEEGSRVSRKVALCLAFLAAHDAEQEANK